MEELKKYIEMHNRKIIDDQEFIEKVKKYVKTKKEENKNAQTF